MSGRHGESRSTCRTRPSHAPFAVREGMDKLKSIVEDAAFHQRTGRVVMELTITLTSEISAIISPVIRKGSAYAACSIFPLLDLQAYLDLF